MRIRAWILRRTDAALLLVNRAQGWTREVWVPDSVIISGRCFNRHSARNEELLDELVRGEIEGWWLDKNPDRAAKLDDFQKV